MGEGERSRPVFGLSRHPGDPWLAQEGVFGASNRAGVKQRVGVKGRPTGSPLGLRWATHTHGDFPGGLCCDSHGLAVEADVCDCRSWRLRSSRKEKIPLIQKSDASPLS